MNFDSDDYYYVKNWFVVKHTPSNEYLVWHNRKVNPWEIIRDNLNYFEARDFVKILNKLYGR